MDPHVTTAFVTATVLNHVFEPLVGHGEKMELVPVLAERWEVSSDYKTLTFHLRKGRLFHNGREMVADDVKYSIERILDPKTGNPRRDVLQKIDRVEVADKHKVVFHMKEKDSSIFYVLAYIAPITAIVPKEEVEKQGGVMKHPVGTGPFKFMEWKPDRHVILERFRLLQTRTRSGQRLRRGENRPCGPAEIRAGGRGIRGHHGLVEQGDRFSPIRSL